MIYEAQVELYFTTCSRFVVLKKIYVHILGPIFRASLKLLKIQFNVQKIEISLAQIKDFVL